MKNDVKEIIRGRLDHLKTLETMEGILWQFGTLPSNFMPSLEHLIVHNYKFSYSVNPRQIYGSIGEHFDIKQNVLDEYKQYRNVLRNTKAILYLKDKVEGIGDIYCAQEIREIGQIGHVTSLSLRCFHLCQPL